jgi:hypothetical protein
MFRFEIGQQLLKHRNGVFSAGSNAEFRIMHSDGKTGVGLIDKFVRSLV